MSLVRQMLCVLAASLALAALLWALHPNRPPWRQVVASGQHDIGLAGARTLAASDRGVLWIDARPSADYAASHLAGALSLNEAEWPDLLVEHLAAITGRPAGQPIVVYCDGAGCGEADRVAERLRAEMAQEPVQVLRGDWRRLRLD